MGANLGFRNLRIIARGTTLLALLATYFPAQVFVNKQRLRINQIWANAWLKALGVRIDLQGATITAHAVLVSNHIGWLDPLVLGYLWPARFITSQSTHANPLLGSVCTMAGCCFVSRKPWSLVKEIEGLRHGLAREGRMAFFPEATSSPGKDILPFRSAFFEIARQAHLPVQPVYIAWDHAVYGYHGEMGFAQSLWNVMSHPKGCISIRVLDPILPNPQQDRKQLALEAETRIRNCHETWNPITAHN